MFTTFLQDLKKIARQLIGLENIFGYKSTAANQIYLLYCFSGNIFFIDRIGKPVKFLWYVLITCQLIYSYSIVLTYFWKTYMFDEESDFMELFITFSSFGCLQVVVLGFPLISRLYRERIETMIDHVDNVFAAAFSLDFDSKQNQVIARAKENFRLFMGIFFIFCIAYSSISYLDIVLFFEESKAKNYLYYSFPPPLIREYGNHESYFLINGVLTIIIIIVGFEVWSVLGILLYWNTICCCELTNIINDLDAEMTVLIDTQESWEVWQTAFERLLMRCVRRFQNVIPLINYLKGFTEAIASFLTLAGFVFGVSCLHICMSVQNELSLVLKVKFMTGCLGTGVTMFLFYWIGQNINTLMIQLSFSIYSTPWYRSVKIRKHVHIFLCHTQSTVDFIIFKVYGLLLNNFLRFWNSVFSFANLLGKLTK